MSSRGNTASKSPNEMTIGVLTSSWYKETMRGWDKRNHYGGKKAEDAHQYQHLCVAAQIHASISIQNGAFSESGDCKCACSTLVVAQKTSWVDVEGDGDGN